MNAIAYRIDNLQYCNWSKEIFQINREAKLDAIHVTIAYHEDFDEVKKNVETWNKRFQEYKDLIFHGKTFEDIENPMPIEPPFGDNIAVLTPITSPDVLNKGPPEFPLFIAASV